MHASLPCRRRCRRFFISDQPFWMFLKRINSGTRTERNSFVHHLRVHAGRSSRSLPDAAALLISAAIRICSGSTPIKLHGINWFGFETGATFVDGLYQVYWFFFPPSPSPSPWRTPDSITCCIGRYCASSTCFVTLQGPTSLTLDFITVLRRIKLLGFNTIRLPMSLKVRPTDAHASATSAAKGNVWSAQQATPR